MTDKYFNLTVRGLGYAQNARAVTPQAGGNSYTRVDIRAMYGKAADGEQDQGKVRYTSFDCIVPAGSRIAEVFNQDVITAINDKNRKVLVSFTAGDISPRSNTDSDGKTWNKITGRLLDVSYIKVDGEIVHQQRKEEAGTDSEEAESDNTDEAEAAAAAE